MNIKWIKFTDRKPRFGEYCLCKKDDEDGDGGFVLFIARYIGMPRRIDYWTHDGIMYDECSVDYLMDACELNNEASK